MVKTEAKEEKTINKNSIVQYLQGVRAEWGKISWPQKPQIIAETIMVTVVTIFFTIVTFLFDIIFKFILGLIP